MTFDAEKFVGTEECKLLFNAIDELAGELDGAETIMGVSDTGRKIEMFFGEIRGRNEDAYNQVFEIEEKLLIEKMNEMLTGELVIIN